MAGIAEVELPAGIELPAVEEAQPVFSLKLEGSLQHLRATLRCRYGERPALTRCPNRKTVLSLVIRRTAAAFLSEILPPKGAAVARLEQAGFAQVAADFEMRDAGRIVRFFAFDFPALPSTWEISLTPRLDKAKGDLQPVAPAIEIVRSGEDWFEMKYSVATAAGEGIPLAEVQRLLRSGQSQTRLTNGKMAVLDPAAFEDFEQVLRDADPRQNQPGVYRLKNPGRLPDEYDRGNWRQPDWGVRDPARRPRTRLPRAARIAVARLSAHRRPLARRSLGTKFGRHSGRRDGSRQNGANARVSPPRSWSRSGSDRLPDVASLQLAARGGAFYAGVECAENRWSESSGENRASSKTRSRPNELRIAPA
jgi:hypothetical protein